MGTRGEQKKMLNKKRRLGWDVVLVVLTGRPKLIVFFLYCERGHI